MKKKFLLLFFLTVTVATPKAFSLETVEEWIDALDESLVLQTPNGFFRTELSGLLDVEFYYADQTTSGLIFGDESFVAPRLSLFVDTEIGDMFYGLLQARIDRGFDPRVKKQDARLDEYFIRFKPLQDSRVNLQFGKFSTVVGNWVNRHSSWENPFITAPGPYENVTIVNDQKAPADPTHFLHYRLTPDNKRKWLPIIWGPAYTTGWSAFGNLNKFDYAIALKNANVSSRPAFWRLTDLNWSNPTVEARVGYRPSEAWNIGTSFAIGAYLHPVASSSLPPGKKIGDYLQTTISQDISYEWKHLQIWFESFWSQFEVPNVGTAETVAYYIEGKYKVTSQLFIAGRWNQQFFSHVDDGNGGQKRWDRNMFRIDTSAGYRLTRHLQLKLQYSYSHQKGNIQQGENLFSAQATLKF